MHVSVRLSYYSYDIRQQVKSRVTIPQRMVLVLDARAARMIRASVSAWPDPDGLFIPERNGKILFMPVFAGILVDATTESRGSIHTIKKRREDRCTDDGRLMCAAVLC
jgi:hypothetical protein